MTSEERRLYHQVHPLKLAADAAALAATAWALAAHALVPGLAAALLIPAAGSAYVLRRSDLEPVRRSWLGRYVKRYMTRAAEAQRIAGFGVVSWAAWSHSYLAAVLGASLIVHAWAQGMLIPRYVRK